jgi:predicted GNAT family N-acyltransferase
MLESELPEAFALTRAHMAVASEEAVQRVLRHNAHSVWGLFRSPDEAGNGATLAGYCSFLLLNQAGKKALCAGEIDPKSPGLDYLVRTGIQPEIIYIWALVAKGFGAIAIPLISQTMGAPYVGQPLYATAGTEAGLRALMGFGYIPAVEGKTGVGALYRQHIEKKPDETPAPRRSHRMTSRFKIVVAKSSEDVDRALAIRAAVFMTEQNCPYDEEFDGNDRTGTHILGLVDGEPAAAMRIRYFAEFVKLERLAVLPRFRRTLIAREIIDGAVNFCRRKGYRKFYGHVQKRLVPFWSKFGFKTLDINYPLVFSDHEYVVMWGELAAHPDAITMHTDPYVILRPEGYWDEPGALDRSALRAPSNPH